jgi:lipopolysaccharide export system permease protein
VVLEHGRRYEGTPGSPDYSVMQFERYSVRLEPKVLTDLPTRTRMLTTVELLRAPQPDYLGELSSRIGMPLAALILSLLAIPLSFVNPRAGRTNNLIMAILIYLIYSNMISVAQAWIAHGKVGFVTGLVAPHALMLTVLVAYFYKRLIVVAPWRRRPAP